MPSAYQTGIATSQANNGVSLTNPSLDPSRPWEYTFQGAETAGPRLPGGNYASNYRGGFGGANVYDGPQGHGIYSFNSPEQNALLAKQHYAKEFRKNLPGMENQMGHGLADAANTQMVSSIGQAKQSNSNRGLLYGGINQGQEQGIRANSANAVAQGQSDINSGLESAANDMDSSAIKQGFNYQAQQQAIQNQIYKQAMASMASSGAALGSVLGAAGAVGGAMVSGGTAAGAGYAAGNAAGRAL